MSYIKTTFANIISFFAAKQDNNIPEHLKGVWSLEKIGNMSILMSLENAEKIGSSNKNYLVKLHEKGNWLFREENLYTKYIFNLIKYSYEFQFNKDYTFAQIYIRLGKIPLYFPKWLMNWTLEYKNNKMIRKTKILGFSEKYEATKLESDKELLNKGLDKLYYCKK